MILISSIIVRINIAGQSNGLFDLVVVAIVLPHQEVRNFSRIFDAASHKPHRKHRYVLAIESRSEAQEMLVASPPLFPLLHRLIPVIALSFKIPFGRCIFKESVKVCTPKSPSFSDDFALYFASFYVLPHCSCAQAQHFRSFVDRQESLTCWTVMPLLFFVHFGFASGAKISGGTGSKLRISVPSKVPIYEP
jgi:hypothetical protein